MKHRPERASALIIEELGKIILKEVEIADTLVTITGVEVTKDLSQATVKISVYPSEKTAETMKMLGKRQGYFQHLLFEKINIKPMPRILFKADAGPEQAARVEKSLMENE